MKLQTSHSKVNLKRSKNCHQVSYLFAALEALRIGLNWTNNKIVFTQCFLYPPRNITESSVSSLFTIPYCSLPRESRPYCISDAAVHPLRPAKDHRLGRLLSYQQPNLTKTT